jgi:hypothetical protein
MNSIFPILAWAAVLCVSLFLVTRNRDVSLTTAIAYIVAGIACLLIHVAVGYGGLALSHRRFEIQQELLLVDLRYGSSVLLASYTLLLGGLIMLVRTISKRK